MELNIRELVSGIPSRLRYVVRYSTSRVEHKETVAEHSYYVILYSLLIADWYEENLPVEGKFARVNYGLLSRKAALHDLEESLSGDFPRMFKYSDMGLLAMLDQASEKAFQKVVKGLTDPKMAAEYAYLWRMSKDESLEGRIVEFCDFLSVLSYLMEERAGGNTGVDRHVKDVSSYFSRFSDSKYDFIRPIVAQCTVLMQSLFPLGDR